MVSTGLPLVGAGPPRPCSRERGRTAQRAREHPRAIVSCPAPVGVEPVEPVDQGLARRGPPPPAGSRHCGGPRRREPSRRDSAAAPPLILRPRLSSPWSPIPVSWPDHHQHRCRPASPGRVPQPADRSASRRGTPRPWKGIEPPSARCPGRGGGCRGGQTVTRTSSRPFIRTAHASPRGRRHISAVRRPRGPARSWSPSAARCGLRWAGTGARGRDQMDWGVSVSRAACSPGRRRRERGRSPATRHRPSWRSP